MDQLASGLLIHNRYRVERSLGEGGFGAVYQAHDERLNRRVAIKQMRRVNERLTRQFTLEAQLLANLEHPVLPRVSDHFAETSGHFLVMDYVPGDDLGRLLQAQGAPFTLDQVLRWADQLLDALEYLHTHTPPIIHRDIKPANLKLSAAGNIRLLDFGLAKGYAGAQERSTFESSVMGYTQGFASPEQVEGHGTEPRSDLYGLGATLYCLLTNRVPHEAAWRMVSLLRQQPDPLRLVHVINPAVPEAVSRVLERALALELADRPESARVMRAQLRMAAENRQSTTPTIVDAAEPASPAPADRGGWVNPVTPPQTAQPTSAWPTAAQSTAARSTPASGTMGQPTEAAQSTPTSGTMGQPTEAAQSTPASGTMGQPTEPVPARVFDLPFPQTPDVVTPPPPARRSLPLFPLITGAVGLLVVFAVGFGLLRLRSREPEVPTVNVGQASAAPSAATSPTAAPPTATADPGQNVREEVAVHLKQMHGAFDRRGGLEDVIREGQAVLRLDPDNAEAHTLLSRLYAWRWQWKQSRAEAEKAIAVDPNNVEAHSWLSQGLRELKQYDKALAEAETAIRLDPQASLGYSSRSTIRGNMALMNHDADLLAQALQDAERAIELAASEDSIHLAEAYADKASMLDQRFQFSHDQADLEQAIEANNKAINAQPNLAVAYANRGAILLHMKRYDEARQALNEAIDRDASLTAAFFFGAEHAAVLGQHDGAIEQYSKALALAGDDPSFAANVYMGRGNSHWGKARADGPDKQAEINAARADMQKAIDLNPEEAWYWRNLGELLTFAEDPEAERTFQTALDLYEKEIKRIATNPNTHLEKGWVLYNLQRYEDASTAFDQAVQLDAKHTDAWYWKGDALYQQGSYEAAAEAFDKLVQLDPAYPDGYFWKGRALYQHGSYGDAVEAFEKAAQQDPADISNYDWKGWALYWQESYQEAAATFDKLVQLDASNPDGYFGKGRALYQLGSYAEAMAALDKAVQLNPGYAEAYLWKGRVHYDQGALKEAAADFDKSVQLDGDNSAAYFWKGRVLYDANSYQPAADAFDKVVQLDGTVDYGYLWKGHALFKLGNKAVACSTLEQGISQVSASEELQKARAEFGCPRT